MHGHALSRVAGFGLASLLLAGATVALAASPTITRSKAAAVASAINLRHGDLPTLEQSPNLTTPQDKRQNAQLTACVGETPEGELFADLSSPAFNGPAPRSLSVSSEVQIAPSTADVARDFAAISRPRALTCVARALVSALRSSLPKGDTASATVRRFTIAVSGVSIVFGLRLTAAVHLKQGNKTVGVPVYIDSIGFANGQAEITLNATSDLAPPSASLESHLANLMAARARSASG
jgi:hypothetical protein